MAFLAFLAGPAAAEPVRIAANWPALIDAEAMRQRIETPRLRIVDLRGKEAYDEGHADGAVSVPIEAWHEAARLGELPALIGNAGIHPSRPLLLVHHDSTLDAFIDTAWLGWELRRRGVHSVTLLEGGMEAWTAAGLRTTERVHNHRVYKLPFEVSELAASSQNEVAGIRLGVADGELLEITGPVGGAPSIEDVPAMSIEQLVGDGRFDQLALLEQLKLTPVSWEAARVVVFSEDPRLAPAFWFLASEVLGIRGISVLPGAAEANVAGLTDG